MDQGAAKPACVLCGRCLEVCPLFAATGREELSPRAKALLAGPSKCAPQGLDPRAVARLAGACLGCGRCEALCPQGVRVPGLVAEQRAGNPDFQRWLWGQWLTRLRPFWPLAARGAGLLPGALAPARLGLALKGLRGLSADGGLAPWLSLTHLPAREFQATHADRSVAVFDGCVGAGPRPRWAATARALLAGLGAPVVEAAFACCGASLGGAGLPEAQREARRANVSAWRAAGRPLLATYCATCGKGLADYDGVFESGEERDVWAGSLRPLSALLAGARGKAGRAAPRVVGWHRPCHAPKDDPDAALLTALLGARLRIPPAAACCGFGGVMQLGAPELSATVAGRCWENLDAALGFSAAPGVTPAYVLTGCSGCVTQLLATAQGAAKVGHWLEIIEPPRAGLGHGR